jgi:hypothetical protein
LLRIKAGSNIGTSAQRIKTNTGTLSMESVGDQYLTEANAVTLAAKTSNNGSIDIETIDGTLSVGTSTLIDGTTVINGVTANGSGNITLSGTSSGGHGIYAQNQSITSVTGDVSLTGKTSSTSSVGGVRLLSANVTGKNITVKADSTATTGNALGYWAFNSQLTASEELNMTGSSVGNNALYQNVGSLSSGKGMIIAGTSQANNSAVGLVGNMTITNGNTGGISITGTGKENFAAINLSGSTMTNGGGDVVLSALKGNVVFDGATNTINNNGTGVVQTQAGNGIATDSGAIDGTKLTITQNGNGGVQVLTSGTGDVKVPKIINNGTGTVVVAAGTAIDKGTGTGGQVKTVAGNTISNDASQTLIYSGNAADTDNLSTLMAGNNLGKLATLYLTNVGTTTEQNAKVNTAFGTPASNTAPVQLMLRENLQFEAKLNPVSLTKNFAEADPTDAAIKAALKGANTSTETTLTTATNTGGKQFKVGTSEFIDTLSGSFNGTAGTTRSAGTYNYSATSNQTNTTAASTDATRSVARLVVKPANITPVPSPVTPSTNPGRVKVASDLANPFALASAEDVANDACSATSLENCHCEESSVNQGVSICYEPNAGSK